MIAVDTSALMAILLDEPEAAACIACLAADDEPVMSAGTVAEALIVAASRGIRAEMERLIDGLAIDVAAVTPAVARQCADAYQRWGKGNHPAGLNFGDCFAYVMARMHGCPLLFSGNDFRRTDVRAAV